MVSDSQHGPGVSINLIYPYRIFKIKQAGYKFVARCKVKVETVNFQLLKL